MIRVFPRRTKHTPTDELAFVGEPPLFRPDAVEVHVSVAFTWDLARAEGLASSWGRYYPKVMLGGPACGDPGNGFVPGRYVDEGVTFTSRGCPNRCPWCFVPEREGGLRLLPIAEGWIVQDNNLLACPWSHIHSVGQMLQQQRKPAQFAGGFEARRVTDRVVEWLQALRVRQLFLAYDHPNAWGDTERAIRRLRQAGLSLNQVRCFVLIGQTGDTQNKAEARLQRTLEAGALPFAMLYRDEENTPQSLAWRQFQRQWARPAISKALARVKA